MYAPPVHRDWEFIKWAAIISLAVALTLAAAGIVVGSDITKPTREPKRLPPDSGANSKPMSSERAKLDLGWNVWRILALHHDGKFSDAIHAWKRLTVPDQTEVWKLVALGHAALATQEMDLAEQSLSQAADLQPENPVVHFLLGILRLEQSRVAPEWPDHVPSRIRLVASPPLQIVPNTKSMYQLAAITELETAIAQAKFIRLDESVIPSGTMTQAALEPTVGDFLIAMSATAFQGKAHNTLGSLYLDLGSLEKAEEHMDAAVAKGLPNIFGYQDLAVAYRKRGQFTEAVRANLKAVAFGQNKATQTVDAIRNLKDALLDF